VKKRNHKRIEERKQKLDARLDRKNQPFGSAPVFAGANVQYEISERHDGTGLCGIAAIHELVKKIKLAETIDQALSLLKIHSPYFESDHVLNIIYNVIAGGTALDDLEHLRRDKSYMDILGAHRIPDPTTSGDFLRRFREDDIVALMDAINEVRLHIWDIRAKDDPSFFNHAIIECDGTLIETLGECKQGMEYTYKKIWGYHPLVVTLANTREVLFVVNRPGNAPSHQGSAAWINKAIELVSRRFKRIEVRGDTDFSLTKHMDGWSERTKFIFGFDASTAMKKKAEALQEADWRELVRQPKYTINTDPRRRPYNVKEEIVFVREFTNYRLLSEQVSEFSYQPRACQTPYRVVVVRKNISEEKGEYSFLPFIKYFFYITNNWEMSQAEVVRGANQRCDQENIIAQLKSGINSLRAPVGDLNANWAYMAIASQAWNLKSWLGLAGAPNAESESVIRMEFKQFQRAVIAVACQVVHAARRVICRVLGFSDKLA